MPDLNVAIVNDQRFSPYALAVSVAALERDYREAEQNLASFNGDVVRKNRLKHTAEALVNRTFAMADLILESKAATLPDAAAMLLHAATNLADMDDRQATQAARAILSAFFVVASAADIDIDKIGFDFYAPFADRPAEHLPDLLAAD